MITIGQVLDRPWKGTMNVADLLDRIDEVSQLGEQSLATVRHTEFGDWLTPESFAAFRSAALSLLTNLFGQDHPYCVDFNSKVVKAKANHAKAGMGILAAAKGELAGGWLVSTRGLISAEIFTDFLEMAEYLLEETYKDPAAVIVGSALEEHLRQLAGKHSVSTTFLRNGNMVAKKADTLNADLASAGAYNKLDQKSVTAWLDLRNKAAHGNYAEYDAKQVALMLEGVRQFITRVSL